MAETKLEKLETKLGEKLGEKLGASLTESTGVQENGNGPTPTVVCSSPLSYTRLATSPPLVYSHPAPPPVNPLPLVNPLPIKIGVPQWSTNESEILFQQFFLNGGDVKKLERYFTGRTIDAISRKVSRELKNRLSNYSVKLVEMGYQGSYTLDDVRNFLQRRTVEIDKLIESRSYLLAQITHNNYLFANSLTAQFNRANEQIQMNMSALADLQNFMFSSLKATNPHFANNTTTVPSSPNPNYTPLTPPYASPPIQPLHATPPISTVPLDPPRPLHPKEQYPSIYTAVSNSLQLTEEEAGELPDEFMDKLKQLAELSGYLVTKKFTREEMVSMNEVEQLLILCNGIVGSCNAPVLNNVLAWIHQETEMLFESFSLRSEKLAKWTSANIIQVAHDLAYHIVSKQTGEFLKRKRETDVEFETSKKTKDEEKPEKPVPILSSSTSSVPAPASASASASTPSPAPAPSTAPSTPTTPTTSTTTTTTTSSSTPVTPSTPASPTPEPTNGPTIHIEDEEKEEEKLKEPKKGRRYTKDDDTEDEKLKKPKKEKQAKTPTRASTRRTNTTISKVSVSKKTPEKE